MKTVWVNDVDIPDGSYARHLVENGHKPSILSLANLRGKAKKYSKWYAEKRDETVTAMIRYYGVYDRKALINSRWCRVWTDKWGNPVKLLIAEKA